MVKRYLGAALVAFVLGCVGPLAVGAAQAAEEPDDTPSLLGSVTGTLGSLTSGDADAEPDVDGPEPEPGGQKPAPEPGEPAPSGPGPAEPEAPGTGGAGGSGVLGAVTTTVNRLADAPRNLLTDVADDAPTPEVPTPDIPVQPEAPEPPADTPPDKPDKPESPGKPETPDNPESPGSTDTPAGPPVNATPALLDVNQSITELEQTAPAPAPQSITQPDTAEPERTQSQRPQQDVPAFLDPTEATGDNPAEQDKPAARPPQDVRAEAISLRHVTQTPFVLAIALLTAVGVVTIRRVVTAK